MSVCDVDNACMRKVKAHHYNHVSQAACGMAATEAATMVTLYALLDPNALVLRARGLRYRFRSSLEDVVALSLARCAAVLLAYGFGAGRKYQRRALRRWWSPPVLLRPELAAAVEISNLIGIEPYHRYLSCIGMVKHQTGETSARQNRPIAKIAMPSGG